MKSESSEKGYTQWKNWDKASTKSVRFSWRFKSANKHLIQPLKAINASNVCELGVGSGRLANYLASLDLRVTALDINAPPKLDERIKFSLGDANVVLPKLSDAPFDAILAIDMLEHVVPEKIESLLEEVHKSLRPGGLFLIHVPNAGSPLGLTFQEGDFTHVSRFSAASIRQVLLSKGFEVVRAKGAPLPLMPILTLLARPAYWVGAFFWKILLTSVGIRADVFPPNLFVIAKKPDR